jgi:hypothetical protein
MPLPPEADLERLRDVVSAQLGLPRSPFLDALAGKTLHRYPPMLEVEEPDPAPDASPAPPREVPLSSLEGGFDAAAAFAVAQLTLAREAETFGLVHDVAVKGDGAAFERLMALLDSALRLRGILYRHGLDPDAEYPALWGRIWEAIPKWDGRDFKAYIARIVRNHCLDEIGRKKKAPKEIEEDPRDPRPRVPSGTLAISHDAMTFVMGVLDELESSGRIKAVDGVIFTLISEGRAVADILEAFHGSPVVARVGTCLELLGVSRARAEHAVLLRLLAEGTAAEDAARITGRPLPEVATVAAALGPLDDDDDRLLARTFSREGISTTDLRRARGLNANALNLIINRIRLKVWMAVVDKAYEALRRRKAAIDDVDLAIVQHRCSIPSPSGCRMYKDETCKRDVGAEEIARKGGLDVAPAVVSRRMQDLRRKLIEEGLGQVFPDYNACLTERKPEKASKGDPS